MKKICTRILAFMLIVVLTFGSGSISVLAETVSENEISGEQVDRNQIGISENDLEVEGTDSFGRMFAEALEEKTYEQQENNGYNIFAIEMNGKEATVNLEALEDCSLIVAVYDESGKKMIAVGTQEISAGSENISVSIDTSNENMPAYFLLRGFLVDTNTCRPLCQAYESPNYTREMQEFFAKTTDDFAEDRVLNFDESKDNNFAVYEDTTIVVEENSVSNQFTTIDENNQKYIVENADSNVTSLSAGDIFVYEAGDEVTIIKVAHVEIEGTTVTIFGSEASMEEVFSYVKIDGSSDVENATVDTTECDAGVQYTGKVVTGDEEYVAENVEENGNGYEMTEEVSGEVSASRKLEYELGKKGAVEGSIAVKLEPSIKFFLTKSYRYMEVKVDYSLDISISISDKADLPIKLGKIKFEPFLGIVLQGNLSFIVESKAELKVTVKLTGKIGASISSDGGTKDLTSSPKVKTELKGKASIFLGLGFDPEIKIINEKVADAKLKTRVGVEIEGELTLYESDKSESEQHACAVCIDGDINFKASASFSVELLSKWKYTYDIAEVKIKLWDWYYSADLDKFGIGKECPNKRYQVEFVVVGTDGKTIKDAVVQMGNSCQKTDKNGSVNTYLSGGKYTVKIEKSGYAAESMDIRIEIARKYKIILREANTGAGGGGGGHGFGDDNDNTGKVRMVSLGEYHSAAVMEDGSLYMWGENNYGQLGVKTYHDINNTPIKVMDNVKMVSCGDNYTGAITEDGSLYMWGGNNYGVLGTGNIKSSSLPIKVMDNVKSVCCGASHVGAITEDGSLYMWGYNLYGQLGNGEYGYGETSVAMSSKPIKIMDDVKSVSCGLRYTGAITKDGSLYMWGHNTWGQLIPEHYLPGDLNAIPVKIMDNIKLISFSVEAYYQEPLIGVLLENNDLYMVGLNKRGQVGCGSEYLYCDLTKVMGNIKLISCGLDHAGALTKDNILYIWGDGFRGELGIGESGEDVKTNVPIKLMSDIKSFDCGNDCTAAITKSGSLYMWGRNNYGQLGNGTTDDSSVPIKVNIPSDSNYIMAEAIGDMQLNENNNVYNGKGSFISLLPNETYNFYAMKSQNADEALTPDNLLYIGQGKSDANGNLNITYETKETYDGAVSFAVGMTTPDISSATISVSNLAYNGKEQYIAPIVTYKGTTLTEGKDYILTGDFRAKDVGNYQFGILGIGMFAGEKKANYSVTGETVKKITSITLDQTSIEMTVGTNRTLTANIQPQNASNKAIRWESDDPSVATVDSNGNITAIRRGQTIIKATTNDGSNLTAQCVVYVKPDENDIPEGPKTWEGKTGTEGFVYRLYNVAMSREADESGFRDWNGKLQRREQSAAEVARGFIFSKEFMNRCYNDVQYVKILYRTMFGREADEGGLNDWLSKLENGMSREYVFRGFAESQEFSNLCDSYGVLRGSITLSAYRDQNVGATGFIARLYTKMLGRGFDEEGLEYWCRKYLTGENTIEEVATVGFLHSKELENLNLSDTEFVTRMYRTFLNREPDEAGLADWVNRLETGRETRDSLVYGFTLSKEFGNIKASYGL